MTDTYKIAFAGELPVEIEVAGATWYLHFLDEQSGAICLIEEMATRGYEHSDTLWLTPIYTK